jgi:ribosome biogenesis GTPase
VSLAAPPASRHEALVLRVSGPTATLLVEGDEHEARLPPRIEGGPVVAGDRVLADLADGTLQVRSIGPRASRLQRGGGPGGGARTLVANADLLIAVAAVTEPPLRPRLLDRYLVASAAGNLHAAIVLTKTDLPHDEEEVARVAERYRAIGYPVLSGSAWDLGLAGRLAALIGDRVAVLAGHSGVGKSTLTTALTGVRREVGAISRKTGTGRHTTTDPRLIPLPGGGAVVDTAGVRTFHLPPMEVREIEAGFREIAAAAAGCRFRGCAHLGDAGCAVPDRVSPERLESYRRLVEPLNP